MFHNQFKAMQKFGHATVNSVRKFGTTVNHDVKRFDAWTKKTAAPAIEKQYHKLKDVQGVLEKKAVPIALGIERGIQTGVKVLEVGAAATGHLEVLPALEGVRRTARAAETYTVQAKGGLDTLRHVEGGIERTVAGGKRIRGGSGGSDGYAEVAHGVVDGVKAAHAHPFKKVAW